MRLSVCSPEALYVTESHTNGIETDLNSNKRLRKGLNDLFARFTHAHTINTHTKRALENHGYTKKGYPGLGQDARISPREGHPLTIN